MLLFLALLCALQRCVAVLQLGGYLPEYRPSSILSALPAQLDLPTANGGFTLEIILFSVEVQPDGRIGKRHVGDSHFEAARSLRSQVTNVRLRTLLCVGGGGRSDSFSAVARSSTARARLVRELLALVHEKDLDGVDFDWEATRTPEEEAGFSALLHDARVAGLWASVALHAGQTLESFDDVRRVHLMAYDYPTPQNGNRHSTLDFAEIAYRWLAEKGCPSEKIVLGIPAYGRGTIDPIRVQTFSEIVDAGGSLTDDEHDGLFYNGATTVAQKVALASKFGMAGVFFWELGQDAIQGSGRLSLLAAAAEAAVVKVEKDTTQKNQVSLWEIALRLSLKLALLATTVYSCANAAATLFSPSTADTDTAIGDEVTHSERFSRGGKVRKKKKQR